MFVLLLHEQYRYKYKDVNQEHVSKMLKWFLSHVPYIHQTNKGFVVTMDIIINLFLNVKVFVKHV